MANESKITSLDAAPEASNPKAASKAVKASGHDRNLSGERADINIFASELEGGNFAVLVGVNEVMYHIPRGVPVNVPVEVVSALRNAITTVTIPNAEGAGGVTERDVPRYNFQVL